MASTTQKCDKCGACQTPLSRCPYCEKHFCEEHYVEHMAWERRHVSDAHEQGHFWRKKHDWPS